MMKLTVWEIHVVENMNIEVADSTNLNTMK